MTICSTFAHVPRIHDPAPSSSLTCASSSPAPAASSARPSFPACSPTATRYRALARDTTRVAQALGPGYQPGSTAEAEVLRGDALTGEGYRMRSQEVEVAYYLIHSMERPGARARPRPFLNRPVRGARADGGRKVRLGGRSSTGSAYRLSRGADGDRGFRHLPPSVQSRDGGADPARRRPGLGGAARVDRDRRALALVSLPRPPRRAPAGAHAARRGASSAPSRSTVATSPSCSPPPPLRRRRPDRSTWADPMCSATAR